MQRNCSTFAIHKHTMSLSVFLEFSSNTSKFSFSLLIIHLTFRLAFLLLCVLSKILFKKLTIMKVQYPLIHTKWLTHPFLLILIITMVMRQTQRLNCTSKILLMRYGTATWITWQTQRLAIIMMILSVLVSSSYHQQINSKMKLEDITQYIQMDQL